MKEKRTFYPSIKLNGYKPGRIHLSEIEAGHNPGSIESGFLDSDEYEMHLPPIEIEIEVPDYKEELDRYLKNDRSNQIKKLEAKLAELKAAS